MYRAQLCTLNKKCAVATTALALIMFLFCVFAVYGASGTQVHSGGMYNFTAQTAPGEELIYQWTASDGSPVISSDKTVSWKSPIVESPTEVVINLLV